MQVHRSNPAADGKEPVDDLYDSIESTKTEDEQNATFDHGISMTALWAGYHRIREMSQSQPLFFDPLAKALMGEENARRAYERMTAELEDSIFMSKAAFEQNEATFFPVRHRFFDDFIYRTLGKALVVMSSLLTV